MRLQMALAVSFVIATMSPVAAQTTRKNIVLLIADDMGRTLGCYGDAVARTPNLDRFAKQGVRFARAYATVASCSPSRASIYSGLYSHQNGMYGLQHGPHAAQSFAWVQGLPNLLRVAGYWTGIIAKVHVGPQASYNWEKEYKSNGRDPDQIAKQTAAFISERGKKSFFLVVGFTDPHRAGPGSFANEKFARDPAEVRFEPDSIKVPYHLPDTPSVRKDLAEYYQSVARLDRGVGQVLKAIADAGELDQTLIIFISDNGIPFPGAKTTLYEAGIRLPLLIASPGQRQGTVNHGIVSYIDLAPTILEYAGAAGPKYKLPGRSLLPILGDENPKGRDVAFGSHQRHEITMDYPMRTIITPQYKLVVNLEHKKDFPFASDLWGSITWQSIRNSSGPSMGKRSVKSFLHRPKEELYDLTADPDELANLASNPALATTLGELRGRLRQWQAETNDPWQILYREEDAKYNLK